MFFFTYMGTDFIWNCFLCSAEVNLFNDSWPFLYQTLLVMSCLMPGTQFKGNWA